jgi:hypothetical protein
MMDKLTVEDCALLEALTDQPRLMASYGPPCDKAQLDSLVQRRLVSAVVYRQGGVIYGLTRAGQRALDGGCQDR